MDGLKFYALTMLSITALYGSLVLANVVLDKAKDQELREKVEVRDRNLDTIPDVTLKASLILSSLSWLSFSSSARASARI